MDKPLTKRPVVRYELDESRVADFLFRLFRKQAVAQSRLQQWPEVKKETITTIRAGIQILYDFSKQQDSKKSSENTESLSVILTKLKKKTITQAELIQIIKEAITIGSGLLWIPFFEFLIQSPERRIKIISLLRKAAEWSVFIPGFSMEKLYEPYIKELSDEIDTYTNRNYDVTFNSIVLFCASIALIVTIASPGGNIPKFLSSIPSSPFYFSVSAFFSYIAVIFGWLFLRNVYQQKKRAYLKDFFSSITDPIRNPELIDDEYLIHVLESFKLMIKTKETPLTKKEYKDTRHFLQIILDIRSWNFRRSAIAWLRAIWDLIASWSWLIILTLSYIILSIEIFLTLKQW